MPEQLLVVAGEASGDLHAARMLTELRASRPQLAAFGLGGGELRAAGLETVADSSEIAVVGIFEALRVLPRAWRIYRRLLEETDRRRPSVAVLVDSPEFNLFLARSLKRRGVRVAYYVSPQIWAWRRGRVKSIRRLVDRMLVLFPFEVDFYRQHGVEVAHVGHPLVDEVPSVEHVWDRDPAPRVHTVSLLPGSRPGEVRSNLPPMLDGLRRMAARLPVRGKLIRAPGVDEELLRGLLTGAPDVEVELVAGRRFETLAQSHLALCASGTATLEVGLTGTPLLVIYRVAAATYSLGRLMVRLPFISLVNLVLERRAVPELLQDDANGERIAGEALALLENPERLREMRASLEELRGRLGRPGASRRAASEVLRLLEVGA